MNRIFAIVNVTQKKKPRLSLARISRFLEISSPFGEGKFQPEAGKKNKVGRFIREREGGREESDDASALRLLCLRIRSDGFAIARDHLNLDLRYIVRRVPFVRFV